VWGYSAPNFEAVAAAYGIPARSISKEMEVAEAARWLHGKTHGPQLLQVMVSHLANAYPKLAFGKGLSCMEPQEKPLDMEST
jgi:acetolactate synthase-1/2/3 large subunit